MTSAPPPRDPALLLKSTPPRAIRGFLDRERLKLSRLELSGAHVAALLAPTGFGKTAQLAQWRRDALAHGAIAFWHTLDARDEPLRLVQGLALCAQAACGKRGFTDSLVRWIEQCVDAREAATGWLAEVAELSVQVLLLLDDVDLLPTRTRTEILSYLLGNAPSNLHIALAGRQTSALMASGTLSVAPVMRVTASDLRFRLDETMQVLSAALGARCNPEAGVRLHELTEGWPLGVQLAAAALKRGGDLDRLLAAATADIQHYFVESLIDRQSADAAYLLVRLAQFDLFHPELCTAVLGRESLADELIRLVDETPLLVRGEGGDWVRLHPLAREVLRTRLARLPAAERQVLARRASEWYAQHELFEEAAHQAFLAGDVETALSLAERTTHAMTVQGHSTAVLSWYGRLSPEEVRQRPRFWAPVAWAFAMSDQHAQAQPLLDLILAQPDSDPSARFEAVLIQATMADFADRFDLSSRALEDWPEPPAYARPDHVPLFTIAKARLTLSNGHPDQARLSLLRIAELDRQQAYSPVSYGFADFCVGLCYLWEGRCALAEQVLRPALLRAEERLERRHPVACMIAALLASASWESGQTDDAAALLAGRLDILKRFGVPDALMAAYRTLARLADHEGRQDHALSLLESLRAIGQDRAMIRLQVAAQFELVRLHAKRGRTETARSLSAQLDALIRSRRTRTPEAVQHWLDLHAELARGHALLAEEAGDRLPQAQQAVEAAISLSTHLKRTGDLVEARLLHAEVLRRNGAAEARSVLNEALSLAQAEGMLRLMRDQGVRREATPTASWSIDEGGATREPLRGNGLLTPKEHEVLTLMSRNLSNKEIALAMQIGEQTIKWHVKNLFHKLNAANRKHAVARARLLGLIDG